MKEKIKIGVIGGSGKSGRFLVKALLEEGFKLKLLLRNPEKFQIQNSFVEVVQADARDFTAMRFFIEGCAAVISTLGQPKGETSIFSSATMNVIRAMEELNLKRSILITGLNVDTPYDKKNVKNKAATEWMKSNFPETTMDKQLEYKLLRESKLDWTLVRLPMIELTDEMHGLQISLEECKGEKVSANDLAHFLTDQLTNDTFIGKAPFISNP